MLIILLWQKNWDNRIAPKFKVNDSVRITKYKNIFSKSCIENWFREIYIIDSVLKTNPWAYKIKDLNGEQIIGRFYEKEFCWVYHKRVIIQNQTVILEIKSKLD